MPTYQYTCLICGHHTEVARPIDKRNDPVYCPVKGCDFKHEMRRELAAPNFVVRGGTPTFHKGNK